MKFVAFLLSKSLFCFFMLIIEYNIVINYKINININFYNKNIEYLGEGGSRKVYLIDGVVLKVPFTEDGEIQSKIENEIKHTNFLATVYNNVYKDTYTDIVIMEHLTPLEKEAGYDLSKKPEYKDIYDYIVKNNINIDIKVLETELLEFSKEYNLWYRDIVSIQNWGLDKNFKFKLFDFGLENEYFEKYYE